MKNHWSGTVSRPRSEYPAPCRPGPAGAVPLTAARRRPAGDKAAPGAKRGSGYGRPGRVRPVAGGFLAFVLGALLQRRADW